MKKLNVYLIIILITFLTGCDRDKDSSTKKDVLPPITQEGKNTFGCKVNGEVWVPQSGFLINALTSSYQSNVFILDAKRETEELDEEIFYSGFFDAVGSYSLPNANHTVEFNKVINSILHYYYVDTINSGVVTITKLDTTEGIIAGTFYFDAIDTTTNEVLHVTDGRFDVKY